MTQDDGRTRMTKANVARGRIGAVVSLLVLSQAMLACRSVPRQVAARDACAGELTLVVNNKSGAAVDVFASGLRYSQGPAGDRIVGSAWPGITSFQVKDSKLGFVARRVSDGSIAATSGAPRSGERVTFDKVCTD